MGRATFLYFVVIFPCLPVPGMLEFRLESHSNIIGVPSLWKAPPVVKFRKR